MTNSLRIVGQNPIGTVAEIAGFTFYLTPCCQAAATGSGDGVACKGCWKPVDERLGGLPVLTCPVCGAPLDEHGCTVEVGHDDEGR